MAFNIVVDRNHLLYSFILKDARYLLNFLRGCKYSMEKTKYKLEMSLTLRNALPEVFTGWDPLLAPMKLALSVG